MPLIATAGEQAPCGHWPILRKRGRGDTVASLRFALTEESKLFLTRLGRSSASAKSAGLDLPTGSVVGHTHTSTTIRRRQDKQVGHGSADCDSGLRSIRERLATGKSRCLSALHFKKLCSCPR